MNPLDTFYCQECGHKFRSVRGAEKAYFGPEGCPECGGSDIDLGPPKLTTPCPPMTSIELVRGEK